MTAKEAVLATKQPMSVYWIRISNTERQKNGLTLGNVSSADKTSKRKLEVFEMGVTGLLAVVAIGGLVLSQGGYFGLPVCLTGIVLWLALTVRFVVGRKRVMFLRPMLPLTFLALAVWYLATTIVASPTVTSMLESGSWFAVAGMAFLAWAQTERSHAITLEALAWLGIVTAVLGFLIFAGLLPVDDGIYQSRLQSTFQYANAAAVWYGATGFLCLFSSKVLRSLSFVPFAAMLLCQSGGETLAYLVVLIVVGIVIVKDSNREELSETVFLFLWVAVVSFLVVSALGESDGLVAGLFIVLAATAYVAFWHPWFRDKLGYSSLSLRALIVGPGACLAMAVVFLLVGHGDRIQQAMDTFTIRLVYDMDAIWVLMSNSLLGVGPDMWRYVYPQLQSAQYAASVVHCSYLQVAVDAGVPTLLLLAFAVFLGLRGLWRRRCGHMGQLACALLIAVHSVLDFDLQFASIAFLFVYVLCQPGFMSCGGNYAPKAVDGDERRALSSLNSAKNDDDECVATGVSAGRLCLPVFGPSVRQAPISRKFATGLVALSLLCAAVCFWALAERSSLEMLGKQSAQSDFAQVASRYSSDPVLFNDPLAQEAYLRSALSEGRIDQVEVFCDRQGVSTASQALFVFEGLSQAGEFELAAEVLLGQLEKEPLNYGFYEKAQKLVNHYGLASGYQKRFGQAVAKANQAAQVQNPLFPKKPRILVS